MFSIMAIDHLMDILNAWVLFRNTKLIKVFSNSLLTFAYSLCCFYLLLLCGWMHRIILKLECSKLHRYRFIYWNNFQDNSTHILHPSSAYLHPYTYYSMCIDDELLCAVSLAVVIAFRRISEHGMSYWLLLIAIFIIQFGLTKYNFHIILHYTVVSCHLFQGPGLSCLRAMSCCSHLFSKCFIVLGQLSYRLLFMYSFINIISIWHLNCFCLS